jgi:hypothetical protein
MLSYASGTIVGNLYSADRTVQYELRPLGRSKGGCFMRAVPYPCHFPHFDLTKAWFAVSRLMLTYNHAAIKCTSTKTNYTYYSY